MDVQEAKDAVLAAARKWVAAETMDEVYAAERALEQTVEEWHRADEGGTDA